MKTCADCGKRKPISEFGKRKNYNNGGEDYIKSYCKECMNRRSVEWQKKNPKKYRDYQNQYHETIIHKKVRKNSTS